MSAQIASPSAGEDLYLRSPHPLHLFLLGGATCLFVGAFLSDWTYFSTHEIQWKNVADWLLFAGLVLGGFALLWALIDFVRAGHERGRRGIYLLLLLAAWVLAVIDELIHGKDAWASMPEALIISGIVSALAVAATVLGFSAIRAQGHER